VIVIVYVIVLIVSQMAEQRNLLWCGDGLWRMKVVVVWQFLPRKKWISDWNSRLISDISPAKSWDLAIFRGGEKLTFQFWAEILSINKVTMPIIGQWCGRRRKMRIKIIKEAYLKSLCLAWVVVAIRVSFQDGFFKRYHW
jgi:hypothetical protein